MYKPIWDQGQMYSSGAWIQVCSLCVHKPKPANNKFDNRLTVVWGNMVCVDHISMMGKNFNKTLDAWMEFDWVLKEDGLWSYRTKPIETIVHYAGNSSLYVACRQEGVTYNPNKIHTLTSIMGDITCKSCLYQLGMGNG